MSKRLVVSEHGQRLIEEVVETTREAVTWRGGKPAEIQAVMRRLGYRKARLRRYIALLEGLVK